MAIILKIFLYTIGVPIVVAFWIAVALICCTVFENKKHYPTIRSASSNLPKRIPMSSKKTGKRVVKPHIIKLR